MCALRLDHARIQLLNHTRTYISSIEMIGNGAHIPCHVTLMSYFARSTLPSICFFLHWYKKFNLNKIRALQIFCGESVGMRACVSACKHTSANCQMCTESVARFMNDVFVCPAVLSYVTFFTVRKYCIFVLFS